DVVRGGPDAARRQDDLRAAEGLAEGGRHPGEVIPDGRLVVEVEPDRGEMPGDDGGVGVNDLAEEELRADGQDFCLHHASRTRNDSRLPRELNSPDPSAI